MALKIICVAGPGSSGKSGIIRRFTATHLKHTRASAEGDVLGIFRMPRRDYAVGVTGRGDNPKLIIEDTQFLNRYRGLRVMIVASRTWGETKQVVETLARNANATLRFVETVTLPASEWGAATDAKVAEIKSLMPRA
jgi:hypothetical protein